jgi:WD40 repeat protein
MGRWDAYSSEKGNHMRLRFGGIVVLLSICALPVRSSILSDASVPDPQSGSARSGAIPGEKRFVRGLPTGVESPERNVIIKSDAGIAEKRNSVQPPRSDSGAIPTIRTVVNEGHAHHVWSVKFSPDGKYLASSGSDQTVKLWDCSSGNLIRDLRGHSHEVVCVRFSPDGRFIASGDMSLKEAEMRLWNFETGSLLTTMLRHGGWGLALVFSSDSKTLASFGSGGLEVWNCATGILDEAIRLPPAARIGLFNSSLRTFTMNLETFAFVSNMGEGQRRIEIYSTRTGQKIRALECNRETTEISLSTNGRYLATASSDGTIRVLSVDSADELAATVLLSMRGSEIVPSSLQFSPDERNIALCHGGKCVTWNWQVENNLRMIDASDAIYTVDWSPSGASLATGGQRVEKLGILCGEIDLWDVRTGAHLRSFGHVISSLVLGIQSAAGHKYFALQTEDTIHLYDVFKYEIAYQIDDQRERITAMDVSPSGANLALGFQNGTIKVWDAKRREYIRQFKACEVRPELIRFLPDGKHIVSIGHESNDMKHSVASVVKVWECDTGVLAKTLDAHTHDDIRSLSLSRDGRWLATSGDMMMSSTKEESNRAPINIWDVTSGKLHKTLSGTGPVAEVIAFAPDGLSLASGSYEGVIRIWNLDSGRYVEVLKPVRLAGIGTNAIDCLSYSSDGRKMAYGTQGGRVGLLNVEKGQLFIEIKCHDQPVDSVAFDRDGACLISAGLDEIRIIEAQTLHLLAEIHIFKDACVIVTPEGFFAGRGDLNKYVHFVSGLQVYEFSQLRDLLYRPDLLEKKLQGEDISKYVGGFTLEEAIKRPPPQ